MLHVPGLFIANTESKGRGVFTAETLEPGTTIEICPVLFIPKDDLDALNKTAVYDYYFLWPDDERVCLALGYGSLYNHDKNPNAEIVFDLEAENILIRSIKEIEAGEEICFHYLDDGSTELPYWF